MSNPRYLANPYWRSLRQPDGHLVADHGFTCEAFPADQAHAATMSFFRERPHSVLDFAERFRIPVVRAARLLLPYIQRQFLLPPESDATRMYRNRIPQMTAKHRVQVTSFGGVGTTMFYGFLGTESVDIPEVRDAGCWKHLPEPPADGQVPPDFRALYLFGDPAEATVSVFRRGLGDFHVRRMLGRLEDWHESMTLDQCLALDRDPFRTTDHFDAWWTAERSYPILFVRYDALWDRLIQVLDFIGLPPGAAADFPARRPRISKLASLSPRKRAALDDRFGELSARLHELPDLIQRGGGDRIADE